jgi:predicted nucleic acid-binding protein
VILVDSSLWIDLLIDPRRVPEAAKRIGELAVCGPVVQEVLQGLDMRKPEAAIMRDSVLELPRLSDPLPSEVFLEAAEIYQEGRRRGYTIRSGVDCLIAAIALRNDVDLWHRDRDFTTIARYTPFRAVTRYLT